MKAMKISEQKLANLIRAAQSVCQTVGGSNPEQCRAAHDEAVANLAAALKDALTRKPRVKK